MADVKRTFVLFSIVFCFIFCHSLRFILNMEELIMHFTEDPEFNCDDSNFWVQVLIPLNQLLLMINPSAHFFIYVFFDQGFRAEISKCFENFQWAFRHVSFIRSDIQVQSIELTEMNN